MHWSPFRLLRNRSGPSLLRRPALRYVLTDQDTNLDIRDTEPIEYIRTRRVSKKDLITQCIPNDEKLWRVSNYRRFLSTRMKLLAKACNAFLDGR